MTKNTKTKSGAQAAPVAAPTQKIIAYKGFDKNLQCRGYQFEIGKSYVHDGEVEACKSGFHACENPLDMWSYYDLTDSKFCEVELSGAVSREAGKDSKIAAANITIKAEIGIPTIVSAAIKWVIDLCRGAPELDDASGYSSKQAASGDHSTQAASGDYSTQAASGDYSTQAASGDYSKQAASGDHSKQAASGDYSTQAASGYSSTQAASGDYSTQAASGDYSKQAASGYSSTQAASGDRSTQAASGYSSTQAASGDYSKQAASGDYSKQALTGKNGVAMAAGKKAKAKAAEGGCFALRWDDENRPRIAVGYVGENGIKAGTWYVVNNAGELVEVQS